ncbi:hypothetical protein R1sor_021129 [Riccia sorocarpa]|uniref:Uncharacterized protein n=1 Tax=Riccia sorocarpa TaxID=122646 RepID=A0ABD3GGX1_9MARC
MDSDLSALAEQIARNSEEARRLQHLLQLKQAGQAQANPPANHGAAQAKTTTPKQLEVELLSGVPFLPRRLEDRTHTAAPRTPAEQRAQGERKYQNCKGEERTRMGLGNSLHRMH